MKFGVAVVAVSGWLRVRRLHRLHRRLDAARGALVDALGRRVRAAADAGVPSAPERYGSWAAREAAANTLGRALARLDRTDLPPDVLAELAEAEQLLALARRVHNDAVRDTLQLRSLAMVRWLRLAGHAPMPRYFEIADPPGAGPQGLGAMQTTPEDGPIRA